jgi:RimJ/RimL family protein N-acetyltransferase
VIRGEKVGLRARHKDDVDVLHEELYNDVATRSRTSGLPWRPIPATDDSPFAATPSYIDIAEFSVVELRSGELAGAARLWDIDQHNRLAHLGVALRSAYRGRGLGTDITRTLCRYGFAILGLRRLQLETLADNAPMIAAATGAGFTVEGTLRRAAWVDGAFVDEVVLGLLAEEWVDQRG